MQPGEELSETQRDSRHTQEWKLLSGASQEADEADAHRHPASSTESRWPQG